jgi:hypothetical protein
MAPVVSVGRIWVGAWILVVLGMGAQASGQQPVPGDTATSATAQAPAGPAAAGDPGAGGDVPPLLALVERRAADDVTVRAVRVDPSLRVDGVLDEPIYQRVAPLTDFIQQEPREGQLATEKTEAWILFDDESFYVAARLWDSQPAREVANELRRDNGNILGNENLTFVIDTLHDRRNGYLFQTNPLGALRDMTITDDQQNSAWNGIWYVKTQRFEQGWTVEVAIPFKTLRYKGAGPQTWGINLRRLVKWKNEFSYLSLVPAALGTTGVSRMASAATVEGLETPAQSKNIELKPYGLASTTGLRRANGLLDSAVGGNGGLDAKYGLTRSLIFDATWRTDFAQVEEDLQQINLTRFSLFFPEKREFFIEGQGIFDFGGVQAGSSPGDVPLLFYSRRIGLNQGQAIPVIGGGRLTGRAGAYSIGALNIHTENTPDAGAVQTGFSALRLKRNVLRRSNVGIMATHRQPARGLPASTSFGADATLLFRTSMNLTGFVARTDTPNRAGVPVTGYSYRGRADYTTDRYGLSAEHLLIDPGFAPDVGFTRRTDVRRTFVQARFSPRPRRSRVVRKLTWQLSGEYVTDAAVRQRQTGEANALFRVDFQSSDQASIEHTREFEYLPAAFTVSPGVVVPQGDYDFQSTRLAYTMGQQRPISGRFSLATGTLYNGRRSDLTYSGRWGLHPRMSVEPTATLNWVSLPYGTFNARLMGARFTVTPTPRMVISSLVQLNVDARTLTSSARLRWEYTGGSEVFFVYSDGRDTALRPGTSTTVQNRTLAFKVTRLFRF